MSAPRLRRRGFVRGILLAAAVFAVALGGLAGPGFGRSSGTSGETTAVLRGIPITVYTYRPPGCARPALLFVFHGNGRGAESYRDSAEPLADRVCLLVFAPLFDKDRFPNWSYHRGGVVDDGELLPPDAWTVTLVADLVAWARRAEGRPDARYYLFGHSAGGQFLSRVAAYAPPLDAEAIVIANPSTQVLPTTDEDAPYGMGLIFPPDDAPERIRDYLRLPVTLYLGLEDTGDEDLTRNAAADRQGDNRLDRGQNVFAMAEDVAGEHGWELGWDLILVPGLGHSARAALAAPQIIEALRLHELEPVN